jgi:hypothetical protein
VTSSTEDIDPILAYLLEFNKTNPIHYKERYLVPINGLQEMLNSFQRFHIDRKEYLIGDEPVETSDLEKLMEMI